MLDVDMSVIPNVLNVPEDKIKSKGIKSVKSRVTNLRPYLDKSIKTSLFLNSAIFF